MRNKLFIQFQKDMKQRLDKGSLKYGNLISECTQDRAIQEVYEELLDVANHAFLLYLRQKELFEKGKLK